MVLSDRSIKEAILQGRIRVNPLDEDDIQPASIDLHIGDQLRLLQKNAKNVIDVREKNSKLTKPAEIPQDGPYLLKPGHFVLATTQERVELGPDLVGRLEGKSSLGRLGLVIHSTAGFIDPGFQGNITLELSNNAQMPITLYRDMKIGQISFTEMTTPADRPYGTPGLGSKYQGQSEPTASRMNEEFNKSSSEHPKGD